MLHCFELFCLFRWALLFCKFTIPSVHFMGNLIFSYFFVFGSYLQYKFTVISLKQIQIVT